MSAGDGRGMHAELTNAGYGPDLPTMLRGLVAQGFRPRGLGVEQRADEIQWVCYPQGETRAWTSVRADDPVGAVRGLYCWSLEHPNVVPTFPAPVSSALDQRRDACGVRCPDYLFAGRCPCVARGYISRAPEPLPIAPVVPGADGSCDG
jgi:hypothetical protein